MNQKFQINLENNIKSQKVLRLIFSYLLQNRKLLLINFNKCMQRIFEIDIDYYKQRSGKCKIGGKNGIGKVFTLNEKKLIFEGEYLNGKKNRKGKGYNLKGDIVYEIKNGNGIIKDYYSNGKIKFEGIYLNGEIKGEGKEFYDKDKINFLKENI